MSIGTNGLMFGQSMGKPEHKPNPNIDIRTFIESIAPSETFTDSRKIIFTRTYKKDENGEQTEYFRRIAFFKQNSSEEYGRIDGLNFSPKRDYYITKNSFIAQQRSEETLFSFDNIVFDLDYHKSNHWKEIDFNVNKLLYVLDNDYEGKFPAFNAVKTGRGVQIWVVLDSFSGKLGFIYAKITEALCDKLQQIIEANDINLELDKAASMDVCRVVRLPYTHNTHRKGFVTEYEHRTDFRYDIDELLEYVEDKPKTRQHKNKVTPKGDWTGLNMKRIRFIEELIKQNEGNCEGRRENMAFLYYNELVQFCKNKETAENKLQELNKTFSKPLNAGQIQIIITEFDRKTEHIGETINGSYIETGYYNISTRVFLDMLNANLSERLTYTNSTSRGIARKKAREAKTERDNKIAELAAEGLTAAQIAEQTGCSVATVKRNRKQDKTTRDKLIIKLSKKGFSTRQIADQVKCSKNTVTKVISTKKQTENPKTS